MINQQEIVDLVKNLSESCSVEVKRWIDPSSVQGIEKLVKGILALRPRAAIEPALTPPV